MHLVWLFDIDGTLLRTEGAAQEAFARAVGERFPGHDPLGDVPFAGRVEPLILQDILTRHRASFDLEDEARFWNSVFAYMRESLTPGRGRLLPGVTELLDAVAGEPRWVRALLTGNMTQMARIKLGHFGIGDRFEFGAFGEEAEDRNALAKVAVARARRRHGVPPERCLVIGDTVHDIACARAAGAFVVAVATGTQDAAALAAQHPDLLLDDLRDTAGLIEWARGITGNGAPRRAGIAGR
jgi:phosphoglycolate phosphatase-like HAD superfamily hydrolase